MANNIAECASDQRAERLARILAAHRMALVGDPCGERLPDELWEQDLPAATAVLAQHAPR